MLQLSLFTTIKKGEKVFIVYSEICMTLYYRTQTFIAKCPNGKLMQGFQRIAT